MAVANDHPVALHLNGEYDQFYEILARKKNYFPFHYKNYERTKTTCHYIKKTPCRLQNVTLKECNVTTKCGVDFRNTRKAFDSSRTKSVNVKKAVSRKPNL